jgi:hypothetical protein
VKAGNEGTIDVQAVLEQETPQQDFETSMTHRQ